jgi:UDP-2-acetamido-3-amino-2,3-dideoxy-glucuronate N-acetyltransferase
MATARTGVGNPGVAVVGAGAWGRNLVRHFHELGALSAICDLSEAVARASEGDHPLTWFTRSYPEVLAAPGIGAVALATPAVTHFEMAKAALEAGKDVFVEKPLALDARDGEALVRLAKDRGRVLMVGHILRYHPAVIALQELVQAGALGNIYYVYSNRLNIGTIRTEENILWSFAPHDISVMLALLNESPLRVTCQGGAYLNKALSDVTLSQFEFASGVQAHIFVSWLHPIKEQRLVVVGSEQMAVFDDMAEHKLVLYPHKVSWKNRVPTAIKGEGRPVAVDPAEPLAQECHHFLECVNGRARPLTDGDEGLEVLRVLDACQRSLFERVAVSMAVETTNREPRVFVHESACVDDGADIGTGTKIWHFAHVMKGARIGERCVLGQNVYVGGDVVVGHNVKIQNNVSIYSGVVMEDDVFLGPSCVLTNVTNPRAQVNRHSLYERTVLKRGCTVGANATIVCGTTIGRYAFVGAGAVVTKDVPDYALVVGNPARRVGWMSRHGHRLGAPDPDGFRHCPESGYRYRQRTDGGLYCVDLDEEAPLPKRLSHGSKPYRAFAAADQRVPP